MEITVCICASIVTAIFTICVIENLERRRIVRKVEYIKHGNLGTGELCYSVEITYDGGMFLFDLVSILGNRYGTLKDLFTRCRDLHWGWNGIMVDLKNSSDSVFLPWAAIRKIEAHVMGNERDDELTKEER